MTGDYNIEVLLYLNIDNIFVTKDVKQSTSFWHSVLLMHLIRMHVMETM